MLRGSSRSCEVRQKLVEDAPLITNAGMLEAAHLIKEEDIVTMGVLVDGRGSDTAGLGKTHLIAGVVLSYDMHDAG